ncbi:hypothetical protein PVL30_000404 [Lodderomyces elongisporus]|uniref:uncharacterized protein n=1 Tax=Lodderomyces elongisporus TaxID=36914 RepID=UPI002923DBFB|nr:uncharacterized protein PVL30_000404 [Lodderomyces elongisporus]WLF76700.1 hypothetical protein PVL30_000404 [Lodderomyces elongisporus]
MDDSVRSLIRFVSRGFYSIPYVLILDAVLRHSVLSEDDLIHLIGIKRKELRSLCNRLVEDRLLVRHVQREDNGQQKYITRTYFYIHITEAIDSIKWKVHTLVNSLKEEMSNYGNPQGYMCPRCGKKISQLDAISLLSEDKTEFVCDVCSGVLIEDDSSQQAIAKQEKLEDLMSQIDPIIKYLKIIDEIQYKIQDNDFESSLLQAIPAQSASTAQYTLSNRVSSKSRSYAQSLQNATARSQATLHVSITANDENYEREQLEKERRRQKLEQNALPSWHTASTVDKQQSVDYVKDEPEDNEVAVAVAAAAAAAAEEGEGDIQKDTTMTSGIKNEDGTPALQIKSEKGEGKNNTTDASSVLPTPEPTNGGASSSSFGAGVAGGTALGISSEAKDREAQDALAAYYAQLAQQEEEEEDDDDDEEEDEDDDDDDDDMEDVDINNDQHVNEQHNNNNNNNSNSNSLEDQNHQINHNEQNGQNEQNEQKKQDAKVKADEDDGDEDDDDDDEDDFDDLI